MKVPGIIYSLLLALGAWLVEYFSPGGMGAGVPWAPILLAAVPIVLKLFTVTTGPAEPRAPKGDPPLGQPSAQSRGLDGQPVPAARPSKARKIFLGG